MSDKITVRTIRSNKANSRRFSIRPVHSSRLANANFTVPGDLWPPTGVIHAEGRDIYEFPTPPVQATFHGGSVIVDARLELIFWGGFWESAADPSVGEVTRAVQTIVQSPYLSELTQYGFHSLTMGGSSIVISPGAPSGTYVADDVTDLVEDLIDDGHFPEPDEPGGNIAYMVFAPEGTRYFDPDFPDTAVGAHTAGWNTVTDVDLFSLGWINHGVLNDMTSWFSHELVEMITDPNPPHGWTVNGPPGYGEFADICVPYYQELGLCNGFEVSAYYSLRLNKCVVPCRPTLRLVQLLAEDKILSYGEREDEDIVTAPQDSYCFKGAYVWKVWSQSEQITVTVDAPSYAKPRVSWTVNGDPNVGPLLTLPVDNSQDPLSDFETLPPETAIIDIYLTETAATFTTREGGGPVSLSLTATVTDSALPEGYQTSRTVDGFIFLSGRVRQMDARYTADKIACFEKRIEGLQSLLVRSALPFVDKGDPIPLRVQRELARIDAAIRTATNAVRLVGAGASAADRKLAP